MHRESRFNVVVVSIIVDLGVVLWTAVFAMRRVYETSQDGNGLGRLGGLLGLKSPCGPQKITVRTDRVVSGHGSFVLAVAMSRIMELKNGPLRLESRF